MGSAQSTHTATSIGETKNLSKQEVINGNVSGLPSSENLDSQTTPELEEASDSTDDEDDDEDEEWNERLAILEDARRLKNIAEYFLKPEMPVAVDATASARCYFDRPSAPQSTDDISDDEDQKIILEDLKQLKQLATDYLHPEIPVTTSDPFACGRNFFTRPSAAPTTDDIGDDEEQKLILEDLKQLEQLATDYLHPEIPVTTTDPFACGRNFFTRPSAAPTTDEECIWDDEEEEAERLRILEETKQMKQQAVHYLQPELPVETTDPFACGRNYFTRPSAPTNEDEEAERLRILEEMKQMKQQAVHYLQPELPVETTDPFGCGRNYFTRPSAPTNEDEDEEELARILEEAKQLKKQAIDYLQPELPVAKTDPFACGRNYFTRPSAPTNEDDVEEEELTRILEETKKLKQQAIDYLQPELPVETTDPFACGRNYFTRPSAPRMSDEDDEEELARILEETKQLKQQVVNYLHPELPVATTDPYACGRNYFNRPSRPTHENVEEEEERAHIIHEAWELKKLADDYLHPERSVEASDPSVFGRNYFTRPSAPTQDFLDELEESACILEELEKMKFLATDYLHPEFPVKTTDPFACSRNYFSRPSAAMPEDDNEDYRTNVLEDAMKLKKLAADYYNPEKPVATTDPTACARNFFTRPSAPGPASQQTHTYCEYVDHGYHHVIDHDHHYYWYNKNEEESVDHEGHFPMDDDHEEKPFYEIKETTLEVDPFKGEHVMDFAPTKDNNERALSRSPQCVLMLTWGGAASSE